MRNRKLVHALSGDDYSGRYAFRGTLCGKALLLTAPATDDPAKVTCASCLKRLTQPAQAQVAP
jgi:hypothetical protein